MYELNINGRELEELPNKEMIEDILLELTDTGNFHFDFHILDPYKYSNLSKIGDIVVHEIEFNKSIVQRKDFFENDYFNTTLSRVVSKIYRIEQIPVMIKVYPKKDIEYSNIEVSKNVLKKLLSYLKNDIIDISYLEYPIHYEIKFVISDIEMLK
jgi:hypothetical protein